MDTFRARDLSDEHIGRHLSGEGVDGVLREFRHVDDMLVEVALDRPPYVVTIPAGRPVTVGTLPLH